MTNKCIAIDFGTSGIRFYKEGRKVKEILQNTSFPELVVLKGVIAYFNPGDALVRKAIREILPGPIPFVSRRPEMLISMPSNPNQVVRRAYRDIADFVGAKSCFLVFDSLTGAIGMEINPLFVL